MHNSFVSACGLRAKDIPRDALLPETTAAGTAAAETSAADENFSHLAQPQNRTNNDSKTAAVNVAGPAASSSPAGTPRASIRFRNMQTRSQTPQMVEKATGHPTAPGSKQKSKKRALAAAVPSTDCDVCSSKGKSHSLLVFSEVVCMHLDKCDMHPA